MSMGMGKGRVRSTSDPPGSIAWRLVGPLAIGALALLLVLAGYYRPILRGGG